MTTQTAASAAQVETLRRDFVPEARAIELQEPPASGRWTLYALLALIVTALAWASLSQIDRLVTGRGRLVAPTANVTVRPLEPGLLKSLNVRVGQVVRQGEVLATLDATFAGSDARQLDSRREKLAMQSQRLQRELAGDRTLTWDGTVLAVAPAGTVAATGSLCGWSTDTSRWVHVNATGSAGGDENFLNVACSLRFGSWAP